MYRFSLCLLLVLAMSCALFAQFRQEQNQDDVGSYLHSRRSLGIPLNAVSLLDPSRMHMSHSMQMGYFSSGSQSGSYGMYLNSMTYEISKPLSVRTHLGFQFQPHGPAEWNPANYGNQFVGGAELNWQPARNFYFHLGAFRGIAPDYGGFGSYGWGRWGMVPYGPRP
ncbi:MAG: hypothetical protein V1784_01485 [bacterium]